MRGSDPQFGRGDCAELAGFGSELAGPNLDYRPGRAGPGRIDSTGLEWG